MATFEKIATVDVGSGGAANIEFTSIPSTFTDLCVKLSARNSSTGEDIWIEINGSTVGFSNKLLYGTGSTALSTSVTTYVGAIPASTYTANTFSSTDIYIPNYAGATNKSISSDSTSENNATFALAVLSATLRSNTAAITSIKVYPNTGSFVQYSSATLYGIKKA
jgi:hypothetical protein